MIEFVPLFALALAAGLIASIYDFKTREVPDYIFRLVLILGISYRIALFIWLRDVGYVYPMLPCFLIFLGLGYLAYHTDLWGGADSKTLISYSVILPYFSLYSMAIFISIFFFSFLAASVPYLAFSHIYLGKVRDIPFVPVFPLALMILISAIVL